MPTPIVICDDSSLARKQLARALPPGWDVSVTLAAGGQEALEAIRAGKGDILFLDLTMPEMDGFDVLTAIRNEDLPTLVIVVSGDIQPESQKRVHQLGAVAFLKKPVDPSELTRVLEEYGVLGVLNAAALEVETPVGFNDWCQEIANVAMGRAADLLAKLIVETVEMSIPKVNLLHPSELNMLMDGLAGNGGLSYVSQGFTGAGIAGETLIIFYDAEATELARLLRYDGEITQSVESELLLDIANVLAGAFLKGFSEQIDFRFSQCHPRVELAGGKRPALAAADSGHNQRRILTLEIGYTLGAERIRCDQLLLITEDSLASLQQRADTMVSWS